MEFIKFRSRRLLRSTAFVLLFSLIAFLIVVLYMDFNVQLNHRFKENTITTMSESSARIVNAIKIKSNDVFLTLNSLALSIAVNEDMFSAEVISLLSKQTLVNNFTTMGVVKMDGTARYTSGDLINIRDREYFQAALSGRNTISKLIVSRLTGQKTLIYAVPLVKNRKIEGVLVCTFRTDHLNELVDFPIFEGQGSLFLIQADGTIAARNHTPLKQDNFFEILSSSQISDGIPAEHIKNNIKNRLSGMIQYTPPQLETRYAYYEPVGLGDWYLISAVPVTYIKAQSASISSLAFRLVLKELALLVLLFGIVMMLQFHTAKDLSDINQKFEALVSNVPGGMFRYAADQYNQFDFISDGLLSIFGYSEQEFRRQFDNSFEKSIYYKDRERVLDTLHRKSSDSAVDQAEYRIECAHGGIRWLLGRGRVISDSAGQRWCYVVVMDITQLKEVQEEIRLSEERYRIVAAQSESMVYEYSAQHGALFHTSFLYKMKFGYPLVQKGFPTSFVEKGFVHPEDSDAFLNLYRNSTVKIPSGSVEVRLLKSDGTYLWCSVQNTTIFSEDGTPLRYIGGILDIDNRRRETESLKHLAELDPLTELYNKASIQSMIATRLAEKDEKSALMFIDVDNFKSINDNLGHLFGDTILSELAARLQKLAGKHNLAGRVGGDEFVLFLANCYDFDELCQRAEEVCSVFRTYSDEGNHIPISCSIGIALSPRDGDTFEELTQKADSALYSAKSKGKNCFEFYSSDTKLVQREISKPTHAPVAAAEYSPQHFTTFIFDILYETHDINSAINLVLSLIGQHFHISRAYISEISPGSEPSTITYEWCAPGVPASKGKVRSLSAAGLNNYKDRFTKNNAFYCDDPSQLDALPFFQSLFKEHDLSSMLHCSILDNGTFSGAVCFEQSTSDTLWANEDKLALTFAGKLLATAVTKMRSGQHCQAQYDAAQAIIDNQNTWTYVIEADTNHLLYMSRRTARDFPNASVDAVCYEAMNKDLLCTRCLTSRMTLDQHKLSEKLFSEATHQWMNYTATRILWPIGNKNALIICFSTAEEC